jgi:TM2 domain-containing membrane protein YozV
MNCATHNDIAAQAFCRTCGKALCANCTRDVRGVIYCENCLAARLDGTAPAAAFVPPAAPAQTIYPPIGIPVAPRPAVGISSGPNPAVAGILAGFFPFGVGAVYCAQYAKGLAHLVVFVLMIVGLSSDLPWFVDTVLGISLGLFYFYQIFDAVRTAKALQAGEPVPDPMGLTQSFSMGDKFDSGKVPIGAVLLIGLGVLFLLHTMGIMEYGFERFWPLIIVFLGAWMFYRQWERSGRRCSCARCRTSCLMGPALVLTTGILFLLHTTHVADMDRTWPAWILVVGVVKLLQSSASSAGHVGPLPPGPAVGAPPPAVEQGPSPSSGEVRNV